MNQGLLIGTYTEALPHVFGKAPGVLEAAWQTDRHAKAVLAAEAVNPSWLAVDANGGWMYAVCETDRFNGTQTGGVASFRQVARLGTWTRAAESSSGGAGPAHLALAPSGKWVVVANYDGGSVAVLPRGEAGLGQPVTVVPHSGSGPNAERQAGPHPHQIVFDPVSGLVLVPDLGADAVVVYALDERTGGLSERGDLRYKADPGAGPRHLAFHPSGDHLFLLNELTNTVDVLGRSGEKFNKVHQAATLPPDFAGHSQAAAIKVSPNGRTVVVSNRGHDSLAIFRFDDDGGPRLKPAGWQSSHGSQPRDIEFSADGSALYVANQNSDSIAVFRTGESAAGLIHAYDIAAPTPVCVVPFG